MRQVNCTSASSPGIRIRHQVSKPIKPRTLALASTAPVSARKAAASIDHPVPRSKQVCCVFSIPAMRIQRQASKRRRPCTVSVASARSSENLPCALYGRHAGHGWTQLHTCSSVEGGRSLLKPAETGDPDRCPRNPGAGRAFACKKLAETGDPDLGSHKPWRWARLLLREAAVRVDYPVSRSKQVGDGRAGPQK